jgi:formate/nitrite transporter FocA (FNT family)
MLKELTRKELLERERIKAELIKEKAKKGVHNFKKEFKKEMNTAILAAFGFLIALVWKDVITNWVNNISEQSPLHGPLISALGVTVVCVLGIMLFSRILKDKEEDENKK